MTKSPKNLATPRQRYLAAVFAVCATLGFSEAVYAADEIKKSVQATFNGQGKLVVKYSCSQTSLGIWSPHRFRVDRIKTNGTVVALVQPNFFNVKGERDFVGIFEVDSGERLRATLACTRGTAAIPVLTLRPPLQ